MDIYNLSVGQFVYSKSGRDKGLPFVVVAVKDNYLWLCDGKIRPANRPKKKKLMHVQPVKIIDENLKTKITEGQQITDSDLRKALLQLINKD